MRHFLKIEGSVVERVLIYGIGNYLKDEIKKLIPTDKLAEFTNTVVALADGDVSKQGKCYLGKKIIGPQSISEYEFDYVVIGASEVYSGEIRNMLVADYSISNGKIMNIRFYVFSFLTQEANLIKSQ